MTMTKAERIESRAAWIPDGARKVSMKNGAAVFYLYERSGKPCARCFIGSAGKPAWRLQFRSEAQRAARIEEQISSLNARDAAKAARVAKPHSLGVGVILSASWGYEQTNVDFYEVVRVIGKTMVEIEKIGTQSASDETTGNSMADYAVPDPERRTGKITRHRVSNGAVRIASYCTAYVWDGRPRYRSWYA